MSEFKFWVKRHNGIYYVDRGFLLKSQWRIAANNLGLHESIAFFLKV